MAKIRQERGFVKRCEILELAEEMATDDTTLTDDDAIAKAEEIVLATTDDHDAAEYRAYMANIENGNE